MQRARLAALTGVVLLTILVPLAGASAGSLEDALFGGVRDEAGVRDVRAGEGAEAAASPEPQVHQEPRDSQDSQDSQNSQNSQDSQEPQGTSGSGGSQDVGGDERRPNDPEGSAAAGDAKGGGEPLLSGLGLTTTARCGPELASPEGVEAQTCVLTQGGDTWARTYYRNATGRELRTVLTLMAPGGRTVQMHCAVSAADEPGACETPREPSRGEPGGYTAVAEFAAADRSAGGKKLPLLLRSGSNSPRPNGS